MKATSWRAAVVDAALGWSVGLRVEVGGPGTVAAAGVVLPRLLADRVGLTRRLRRALARAGFIPGRDRGRALVDACAAMAAGASCLSDIEEATAQEEIFGPGGGASDSTLLRILDELAGRLGAHGLPGRRLAEATSAARARAWTEIAAATVRFPRSRSPGATRCAITATGRAPRSWCCAWTPHSSRPPRTRRRRQEPTRAGSAFTR
ncbi:MAG TPA: hypothetical protein VE709_03050 [Pseudonocardiaceae bacterium]|nr:hypothetical protein [Pseudonocardiaceae bacterium]